MNQLYLFLLLWSINNNTQNVVSQRKGDLSVSQPVCFTVTILAKWKLILERLEMILVGQKWFLRDEKNSRKREMILNNEFIVKYIICRHLQICFITFTNQKYFITGVCNARKCIQCSSELRQSAPLSLPDQLFQLISNQSGKEYGTHCTYAYWFFYTLYVHMLKNRHKTVQQGWINEYFS